MACLFISSSDLQLKKFRGNLATEYWQTPDPAAPGNVKQCDASGEDPSCSSSIPSGGINDEHTTVRLHIVK
jgi:hypothetical protein